MKKYLGICLALIPAILVFVLTVFDPFYGLDAMLCDRIYSQMNGHGDTIKLICIDEETLAEYGPMSTWTREKSAELIDVLYQEEQSKPLLLAFDIMFIGENDKETDDRLAKAAQRAGNVIVASNLVYRGKASYTAGGVPYYDSWNIETEEKPYDALNTCVNSGYANAQLSKDGFVRTAQLSTMVNGETRSSFPALIYKKYVELTGGWDNYSNYKNNQIQFFYSGKPGECIHYSLKDVLDGKIPVKEFAGSIVMVGAYAPGLQDAYHNSAKRGQDMYGVEINANIVRALITGKTATRVNVILVGIILALILMAYTLLARNMKMYPAILVGIWILLGIGITGRLLAVNGYVISLVYALITVLLVQAWIIIEKYVMEAVGRRQTLNSFKKYMAPQVIDNLAKTGNFHVELGGERRHIAVLFVDIRGFTSMSEVLEPEQMVKILNRYLSLTTQCIFENGGMHDKFIGDATMALFNAPNDQEDYVIKAIMAGLAMQKKGEVLGRELKEEFGRTVSFGIGIHAGDAVVGNIGCDTRMDYTAIGDTVNTAARIEGQAGSGEVLISEEVFKMVENRVIVENKGFLTLKGKKEPVKVYNVIDLVSNEVGDLNSV